MGRNGRSTGGERAAQGVEVRGAQGL